MNRLPMLCLLSLALAACAPQKPVGLSGATEIESGAQDERFRANGKSGGNITCQVKAMRLLPKLDPHAFSVYKESPAFFLRKAWWSCDDFVSDLNTAVHESTHNLSAEKSAYAMADGTLLKRVPDSGAFYPPSELTPQIDPSWNHAFYIIEGRKEGQPSSQRHFTYLLDEFNAYSVGLNTENLFHIHKMATDDARDGAFAFMHYLDLYVARAKSAHPDTWAALKAEPTQGTIRKLWKQGVAVEAQACKLNTSGIQDGIYLEKLCQAKGHEALEEILGEKVTCFKECLELTKYRSDY